MSEPPEKPSRVNQYSTVNYRNIVNGGFRTKKCDFIPDKDEMAAHFKEHYTQKRVSKNFVQLLFTAVNRNTFGKSDPLSRKDEDFFIGRLKQYKVHKLILGLPAYQDQTTTPSQLNTLFTAHDRAVKTSCELGLHWERANENRKPFDVLLNLETPIFNHVKRVMVFPQEKLFTIALNKCKNFTASLINVVSNKPHSFHEPALTNSLR
jgi:hypothetical protein